MENFKNIGKKVQENISSETKKTRSKKLDRIKNIKEEEGLDAAVEEINSSNPNEERANIDMLATRRMVLAQENNEKIDYPKILLAYRDNNLYNKYIPVLLEKMQKDGREVETLAFSRDTKEKDIKNIVEETQNPLSGELFEVVADGTLFKSGLSEITEDKIEGYNLDRLFKNIVSEKLGINPENTAGGIEKLDDEIQSIVRLCTSIIEGNKADAFYLVKQALTSHNFAPVFSPDLETMESKGSFDRKKEAYPNDLKEKFNSLVERYKNLGIDAEVLFGGSMLSVKDPAYLEKLKYGDIIAEKIAEKISESFPASKIHIVSEITDVPANNNIAVLYDRHAAHSEEPKSKLRIILPIESGVDYLIENSLIDTEIDFTREIEKQVDKIINKEHFKRIIQEEIKTKETKKSE